MSAAPSATLVLGASTKPERYSHRAVHRLIAHGHRVIAVGRRSGDVAGNPILSEWPKDAIIDTVTVYLNPVNQLEWVDRIIAARPRRIIFNPGAENAVFAQRAEQAGIVVENACTLVLLATGAY